MPTNKEVGVFLGYLQSTMNFEQVARQVFERIVHGLRHGLMILQGPSKIANKSFFLNMVKAFSAGVPPAAKTYFSHDMQRLLDKVDASQYCCVDMKEDYPGKASDLYSIPIYLTLPLIFASASQKKGLKKGRRIVVLCDNLQEYLRHNEQQQIIFLKQVAELTQDYHELSFLAAYTPQGAKDLETTAVSEYVLPIGESGKSTD